MFQPELQSSAKTIEKAPVLTNIKRKVQIFEKLASSSKSNSGPRILNVVPPATTNVRNLLKSFEVIHTVSPDNTCRSKSPTSSDFPSLKSRLKVLKMSTVNDSDDVHLAKDLKNLRNVRI
jgi:hypothetical protein